MSLARQRDHEERLRRLALRRRRSGDRALPGRKGFMVSAQGDWFNSAPAAEGTVSFDGSEEEIVDRIVIDPDYVGPPVDDRFHVTLHAAWPFPRALDVELNGFKIWDRAFAVDNDIGSIAMFGYSDDVGWRVNSGAFRLYSYHGPASSPDRYNNDGTYPQFGQGGVTGYPLVSHFGDPDLATVFNGTARNGIWELKLTVDQDYFGTDPIPADRLLKLWRWSIHFGQELGFPFEDDWQYIYWDTVVFADPGFTLSANRGFITISEPGWYRYAAHARLSSIDGASGNTKRAVMATLSVSGETISEDGQVPGDLISSTETAGAGATSGWFYVPDGGADVTLGVVPQNNVSDLGINTGQGVSLHLDAASFAAWKVFDA